MPYVGVGVGHSMEPKGCLGCRVWGSEGAGTPSDSRTRCERLLGAQGSGTFPAIGSPSR